MNTLIRAALIRALWTAGETLVSTLPAGIVITPAMIQSLDWTFLFVILAWLGTGALSFVITFFKCLKTGLPEVDYEQHLYMSVDEPNDAEVTDDDE